MRIVIVGAGTSGLYAAIVLARGGYDVTVGNNGAFAPNVPGYPAQTGWDPVTGLGTPNAANLVPALAS